MARLSALPAQPVLGDGCARIADSVLDAVVTLAQDGRVVRFNHGAERMFGYTRAQAVGAPLGELVVPPELRAAHHATLRRLAAGGASTILDRRLELPALRRGGARFPAEVTLVRTGVSPPRYTAVVRDLSDRRRAERRRLRMRRLLSEAEQLAQVGSWEVDLRSGGAIWSDGMYRIHGFAPGQVEPGVDLVVDLIHPEDRETVVPVLATALQRPQEMPPGGVALEYRIVRPDASVRQLRGRGRVELDERGRHARWVASAQDVTDQRLTERELQAHYAVGQALRDWESFEEGVVGLLRRLAAALDFALGALWIWDEADRALVCRAFWRAPGVEAGEFETATRAARFRPGEGVPGRAWRTGLPVITEDVSTDPRFSRRAAAASLGLRSGLAFTASTDDGPLAVLSFYGFDRRAPSERLVRTLTGIGRELGRFLASRRGELGGRALSARELEVLRLAADGHSGPEIAERLVLSPATVKTHFEHVYEKLGVTDRAAAVAQALRTGVIQ